MLVGRSDSIPSPEEGGALNASVPLRRPWDPGLEWQDVVSRQDYHEAFFYHGSQGALAAVRWQQWKLHLNPALTLYDLQRDPGESKPVRNGTIQRKLRGMVVLFQEEMRDGARPVGIVAAEQPETPRQDAR
jgi:hypothetical protein